MKIGFIGCGNMASAMISGILKKGIFKKEEIIASNLTDAGEKRTRETLGIEVNRNNREIVKSAPIVVLAVKPQFYEEVLNEVRDEIREDQLIVSIAPGKTFEWLKEKIGKAVPMARLMPNTPAKVSEGMTGACVNELVSDAQKEQLTEILNSFGKAEYVPERLMDAVVAASGSSPAYVFMFIEAMADAAVTMGMPRKQAYVFTAQAVLGSAKLMLETGMHPGELKDMVCSPAGTTIEGVRTLEKAGMRSAVMEALIASAEKGKKI